MIRLTVRDIVQATEGKLLSGSGNAVVGGLSVDSRTIKPGEFFIAIRGSNFNGHDFIPDAAEKGASGLIVEQLPDPACLGKIDHLIVVGNAREAMGMVAAEIRKRVNIPVVCITGSNGKTTVKNILSSILSVRHSVLNSKKSYNNILGLSLTLFDLDQSHDVAVLELGTNHPGEISELARIAGPHMAVITNIGDGHLEFFASREGVFVEKMSLLNFLPDTGMVFLNKDDRLLARAGTRDVMKKFYGMSPGCDFLITRLFREKEGYGFFLNGNRFFLPLEGSHNVYNAAAAIAVAEYFGMSHKDMQGALETVSLPEMRLEKVNVDGLVFINDSYNANPDSFECALKVLQDNGAGGPKGVVAGDMLELGSGSDEFHRMIGRSIVGNGVDFLITLGSKARHIAEGALESGMEKSRVLCAASHEDAAEMVRQTADPGTVILLKGSRATRMEEVLKCFTTSCIR
jgi:UDP-N-acetylmuramoyl-tripeptide--D-alanyl-D-alanine ligase